MNALLPAVLAALAAWLAVDSPDRLLSTRLDVQPVDRVSRPRGKRGLWIAGAFAAVVSAGMVGGRRAAVLAVVVVIAGGTAGFLRGRAVRRRRAGETRAEVVRAGEVLAGLLRVGAIPATALSAAACEHPVLAEAAALQGVGGDVVAALRRSSTLPGREGLRDLAAAWEVAQRTGASMCDSIEAVADELRRREEAAGTVRVELSASRAAGRLMAALPLAGVLLGYGFGGDPLVFLTRNLLGEACLLSAVGLAALGLVWTDVIAERAAR